jgi:TonB family protein
MNVKKQISFAFIAFVLLSVEVTSAGILPESDSSQKAAKQTKKARKQDKGFFCGTSFSVVTTEMQLTIEPQSGDAVLGQAIRRVEPGYPSQAKAKRVEGNVIVEALVSKSGEVLSIRSVSGPPALIEASSDAAKGWRFTPTTVNQAPVEAHAKITFKYDLGLNQEKESSQPTRKTRIQK